MDLLRRVICTLNALGLLTTLAIGQVSEGPSLDEVKKLVVMIESEGRSGSGIVFAVQGGSVYIAAPHHLVAAGEHGGLGLRVRFWQRQTETYVAELIRTNPEHDLAVIRARAVGLQFQMDRLGNPVLQKAADRVYAIGYGARVNGWDLERSPGVIDRIGSQTLYFQSLVRAGYSGGALIDDRGLIAGMVLATDGIMNSALRIDRMVELLKLDFSMPVQLSMPVVPEAGTDLRPTATRINPKDGQRYVLIPPGVFAMGCSKGDSQCDADESPRHEVVISREFWIGQTEVTQEAYQRVMGANPSEFRGNERPVESVSWTQANHYCTNVGGRLPSESEWEYAARAGSVGPRPGPLDEIAWYRGNAENGTHAVGGKQPNNWGLYDMLGNVWEWVGDWHDSRTYQMGESRDPQGPRSGAQRVLRGGHWGSNPESLRVSYRSSNDPVFRHAGLGFRCAVEFR